MRCCRVTAAVSVLAAFAIPARAQQPTTRIYAVHRAIKVDPAKRADFEKLFRGTVKNYHIARKNGGVETGWALSKVVLPAGSESPYDYLSTTYTDKFPSLDPAPGENAPFLEKAGTTPEKFSALLRELGTLVRTTVSVGIEMAGAIEPGDYMRVDYMKTPPGRSADYVNMERTVYKALHEQRIKEGIISAWSLHAMVFPGGSEREYDFYTINAVKQSSGFGNQRGYGSDFFVKVHPNLNYLNTMNRTPELRTIVNTRYARALEVIR